MYSCHFLLLFALLFTVNFLSIWTFLYPLLSGLCPHHSPHNYPSITSNLQWPTSVLFLVPICLISLCHYMILNAPLGALLPGFYMLLILLYLCFSYILYFLWSFMPSIYSLPLFCLLQIKESNNYISHLYADDSPNSYIIYISLFYQSHL